MKHAAISLALPAVLCLLWESSSRLGWVPSALLAPPSVVGFRILELIADGTLLMHAWTSLVRLGIGFILGSSTGIAVGLVCGMSQIVQRALNPTIQFFAPIPPIVWIPILIALLGIGESSKIALLAMACFFLVSVNTFEGVRSVDTRLVELVDVLNKSSFDRVRHLFVPTALPHIFLGMRLALGLSWVLLIAAEVIASSAGLGWFVWDARTFARPDDMYSAIVLIGLLGKLSDVLLIRMTRWMTQWNNGFEGR